MEEAKIPLTIGAVSEHRTGNINFHIGYAGPLGGTNEDKQVKVDISKNELLKFDIVENPMFMRYSDEQPCAMRCYSLSEIMVEKMRSLLSRQQPRDFYDLWYLSEHGGLEMIDYWHEFEEKSHHKHLKPELLADRLKRILPVFRMQWRIFLAAQIKDLPPFEQVERQLGRHFRKVFQHKQITQKRSGIHL